MTCNISTFYYLSTHLMLALSIVLTYVLASYNRKKSPCLLSFLSQSRQENKAIAERTIQHCSLDGLALLIYLLSISSRLR